MEPYLNFPHVHLPKWGYAPDSELLIPSVNGESFPGTGHCVLIIKDKLSKENDNQSMTIDQTKASGGISVMTLISHNETPPLSETTQAQGVHGESHENVSHNPSQYKLITSPKHTHQDKQTTGTQCQPIEIPPPCSRGLRQTMFQTSRRKNTLKDDFQRNHSCISFLPDNR